MLMFFQSVWFFKSMDAGGFATVPLAAWDCWKGRAGHLAAHGLGRKP